MGEWLLMDARERVLMHVEVPSACEYSLVQRACGAQAGTPPRQDGGVIMDRGMP